ncbi:MAG: tetratricopeptide repeat protein [Deltaproteobacteria bacterium]|nr:tetratricopeptide repeat protein [Deltaproteobacteria bacterium]
MKSLSILLCSLATGLIIGLALASPALAREDGFSLYRAGKYAEAAKAFAKADMDRPDEIRFRYNRGVAALKAGEAEAGEAALESALARSKDSEVRYRSAYNLGNAAFEKKDFRKAADYYKKALAERPKDPDARANFQLALWNAYRAEKEKAGEKSETGKDKKDSEGKKDEKKKDEGKDGKKSETGQGKEDSGRDGKQQGGKEKDQGRETKGDEPSPVRPEDLKGALSAQGAHSKPGQQAKAGAGKAPSMERLRAEAMVENVTEDSSLLFRGLEGQKRKTGSGKDW